MIEFSTKLQNVEISQAALLVVSPHDALIATLKILGTLTRSMMESVFNIVNSDILDSSNCLKYFYQRCFPGNDDFSKQILNSKILNSNLVTLIK